MFLVQGFPTPRYASATSCRGDRHLLSDRFSRRGLARPLSRTCQRHNRHSWFLPGARVSCRLRAARRFSRLCRRIQRHRCRWYGVFTPWSPSPGHGASAAGFAASRDGGSDGRGCNRVPVRLLESLGIRFDLAAYPSSHGCGGHSSTCCGASITRGWPTPASRPRKARQHHPRLRQPGLQPQFHHRQLRHVRN